MADARVEKRPRVIGWLVAAMMASVVSQLWLGDGSTVSLDYSDVKALLVRGQIGDVRILERNVTGNVTIPALLSQETVERAAPIDMLRDTGQSRRSSVQPRTRVAAPSS